MSKNFLLLLILLFVTTTALAQGSAAERATEISNKMTEVLSLNEDESAKVYNIQLKRFQDDNAIRNTYADDPETKRLELKKVYDRLYGKLKAALGEDKMLEWGAYKRNN